MAVQEGDFWGVYFDVHGDLLRSKVPEGTPVLEIELRRIEMRTSKPVVPKSVAPAQQDSDAETARDSDDGESQGSPKLDSPEVD